MFGKEPMSKYKSQIANLLIILILVIIAINIHKNQNKNVISATEKKDTEMKKNKILKEISQLEGKIDTLRAMVNNKDVNMAINTLGNIAKESSVKISSVRPATEQDFPLYVKYPFELRVEANSFHAIGKFIGKIESHTDIYTVESMEIEPQLNIQEGRLERVIAGLRINTVLFKLK